jgi:hypothetical protein
MMWHEVIFLNFYNYFLIQKYDVAWGGVAYLHVDKIKINDL